MAVWQCRTKREILRSIHSRHVGTCNLPSCQALIAMDFFHCSDFTIYCWIIRSISVLHLSSLRPYRCGFLSNLLCKYLCDYTFVRTANSNKHNYVVSQPPKIMAKRFSVMCLICFCEWQSQRSYKGSESGDWSK